MQNLGISEIISYPVLYHDWIFVYDKISCSFFSASRCDPNPCENEGTCQNNDKVVDGYVCVCTLDYAGKKCQGNILLTVTRDCHHLDIDLH